MVQDLPFSELISRARDGDQAAWETIWEQYVPQIRKILRRQWRRQCQVLNRDLDDVLQSVWCRLLQHPGGLRFDTQDDFLRYFLATARNLLLQQLRNAARQSPSGADPRAKKTGRGQNHRSELDMLVERESVDHLRRRLTGDEWDVVDHRAQGKSWSDIARVLQQTPAAVRACYRRIRRRFLGNTE